MQYRGILLTVLFLFVVSASAFAGRLETIQSTTTDDLYAADYHPSGQYALVVGAGMFSYDTAGLTRIPCNPQRYFDVDWRPQGDFALIVGEFGAIFSYDGSTLTGVYSPVASTLNGVAFSPSGDQAVIVGEGGAFLVWENNTVTDYSMSPGITFEGVTWVPDGRSALAVGIESFANEEIVRWNRTAPVVEWTGSAVWPGGISYHPTDDYALIVEDWCHAAIYDKNGFTRIETGYEQMSDGLNSVDWSPDGATALITGAWAHGPFPGIRTLMEFDGTDFNALRMFSNGLPIYEGVAWKADSSAALVVGQQGSLALYHTDTAILGNVYCDKDTYVGGENVKVFVDLHNRGAAACNIEAGVSVSVDYQQRLWWPRMSPQLNFVPLSLQPGQSITGFQLLDVKTNLVKYQKNFTWELWIFEQGNIKVEGVLSYDVFRGMLIP